MTCPLHVLDIKHALPRVLLLDKYLDCCRLYRRTELIWIVERTQILHKLIMLTSDADQKFERPREFAATAPERSEPNSHSQWYHARFDFRRHNSFHHKLWLFEDHWK